MGNMRDVLTLEYIDKETTIFDLEEPGFIQKKSYEWGTLLCNCVKLPKMMGTEGINMLFSVNFPFSTYVYTDSSSKLFSVNFSTGYTPVR